MLGLWNEYEIYEWDIEYKYRIRSKIMGIG